MKPTKNVLYHVSSACTLFNFVFDLLKWDQKLKSIYHNILFYLVIRSSASDTYNFDLMYHTAQIYSGITRGRVLNGELYTQRLQKLIYLYLFKAGSWRFPSTLKDLKWTWWRSWRVEGNLHETASRVIQIN